MLLLDEPLGALDLKLRKEMQLELKRLQREMNITFVYVTHDQEEALTMSDTVVVMSGGKIQQIGSPQDIYNEPKNAFVARFIGDSNIVDGVMLRDFFVNFGGHDFTCVDRGFKPNEPVQVVIRPEDVQIVPPSVGMLTGLVREVIFKGVHFEMHVDVEGYEWLIHSTQAQSARRADRHEHRPRRNSYHEAFGGVTAMLKSKTSRWLAGPYLLWMAAFIVVPLVIVVWYALTATPDGQFTLDNLTQIGRYSSVFARAA